MTEFCGQLKEYMYKNRCSSYEELSRKFRRQGYEYSANAIGKYSNGTRKIPENFIKHTSHILHLSSKEERKLYEAHLTDVLHFLGGNEGLRCYIESRSQATSNLSE